MKVSNIYISNNIAVKYFFVRLKNYTFAIEIARIARENCKN